MSVACVGSIELTLDHTPREDMSGGKTNEIEVSKIEIVSQGCSRSKVSPSLLTGNKWTSDGLTFGRLHPCCEQMGSVQVFNTWAILIENFT